MRIVRAGYVFMGLLGAAALRAQTPAGVPAATGTTGVPQVGGDPATTLRPPKPMKELRVTFITHDGKPGGFATLKPDKTGGVKVTVQLENIPFGPHGVHLHQNADCTGPDFKTAGPHFIPTAKQHGFENPMGHHAGDAPVNIDVGEDHTGSATFVLKDVTFKADAPNSIFANGGTALVIHEKADDMKTDPSGASGNRIACAVVKP